MHSLPPLIQDLALILLTASLVATTFRKIGLPVILGYLIAGLLVGPSFKLFPSVGDVANINIWAQLGIILLLFSLGLEFNFKKLTSIGGPAVIVALTEMIGIFSLGTVVGHYLLDWSWLQSLFLGAIICMSSTSIIVKTFEELNLKSRNFAQLVMGILVLEDLAAVLLLVLLTTLTLTQTFSGGELVIAGSKLGLFVILTFVIGIVLVPWIVHRLKKWFTDELILLFALSLCLLLVVLADKVGFSAALGAFMMGSLVSETHEKERVEKLMRPIRDLFLAVFFVSVGALIDLQQFWIHLPVILVVSGLVIVGNIFFATMGGMLVGYQPRSALDIGISLSQIGEFGFIFAGLAIATKVAGPELYAISVGVCLVTAFTSPFLLRNHEKVSAVFVHLIPEAVGRGLNQYSATSRLVIASPQWRALATSYVIKILINSVIVVGLYLFAYYLLFPFLREELESRRWAQIITLVSMAIIASPFLWALVFSKSADEELNLFLKDRLSPRVRQSLFVLRAFWAFVLVTIMVAQFLSFKYVILFTFVLFVSFLFVLYKYLGRIYAMFEKRFLTQLNSPQAAGKKTKAPVLAPWDAHLAQVIIPIESKFVGVPLLSLGLREKYGVIITAIERGELFLTAPNRDQMLMPLDRLYLIGTDQQLAHFEQDLKIQIYPAGEQHEEMHLEPLLLNDSSPFIGKAIRDSGVREEYKGLVVGLERQGQRYLNPDSAMILEPGDLLWLVR